MSSPMGAEDIPARDALRASSRPVKYKTGLGVSRARNRKVVHRVRLMTAAYTEGRIRYFADWICGDRSWDALPVSTAEPFGGLCKRCESLAQGPFVYRCYGTGVRPLYIGSAKSRLSRLQSHRAGSPWWSEVTRVDIEDQPDIETARRAEAAAIEAERPVHNKKHNRQVREAA